MEAVYTHATTYTTPAGVKVSVGDLIASHRGGFGGGNFQQYVYVGVITDIKRYAPNGRWQICYELLSDNTGYSRTTWAHTFAKYEYSLQHFKHEGA